MDALKIATWNVNGVRARQGELLGWLATERPDVVCLQETKASLDQLPFELRDVDGYQDPATIHRRPFPVRQQPPRPPVCQAACSGGSLAARTRETANDASGSL